MQHLFHIVPRAQWSDVVDTYRPDSLLIVELDPSTIGSEIRVEDSTRSGISYPHVYGPIPRRSAVAVHVLQRDVSGHYLFSPSSRLP